MKCEQAFLRSKACDDGMKRDRKQIKRVEKKMRRRERRESVGVVVSIGRIDIIA